MGGRIAPDSPTEGNVDLKETIFNDKREIFKQLRKVEVFKNIQVSLNIVCWSNDLDLAPEYLKDKMVEQKQFS